MAILAKFRHFLAKIAPHIEISIILTGFYVEKKIIFFILNELRNLVQESAFAFCDTPLFRGSPKVCWEPGQIMLRARGIVRNGEDMSNTGCSSI